MGVPGGASAIRLSTLEAQVAEHNKADDCWSVYRGKVYDTTAFHEYHPGGVKYMLAAAGKDGTKLFDKFHRCGAAGRRGRCRGLSGGWHCRWVNIDFIMETLYIGPLVGEDGLPIQDVAEEEEEEEEEEEGGGGGKR